MPNDAKLNDELTKVFQDGSVFSAPDEDLEKYLKHLCSGHVPNEMVRHREMNRCQVINTIKTFRFINSVQRSNLIFTVIIIILTIATVYLTYKSTSQSQESSQQIERLIQIQENKEELIAKKLTEQIESQNKITEKIMHGNELIVMELKKLSSVNNEIEKLLNKKNTSNNKMKADEK